MSKGRIIIATDRQVQRANTRLEALYLTRADLSDEYEDKAGALSAARETSGELDRPPWATGHSNREVKAFAARRGLNPWRYYALD